MAKFGGKVGFGINTEARPGVWVDEITERSYYGDVVRNSRMLQEGEHLNPDLRVNNAISIVADAHLREHFFAIKYVVWEGVRWAVPTVEVQPPRLILQLGERYNGPIPT